jgi:hypothetical protein
MCNNSSFSKYENKTNKISLDKKILDDKLDGNFVDFSMDVWIDIG